MENRNKILATLVAGAQAVDHMLNVEVFFEQPDWRCRQILRQPLRARLI